MSIQIQIIKEETTLFRFDIPLNFACLPAGRDFDI